MKAKDKAEDLFDKYIDLYPSYKDIDKAEKNIKKCALIAVDEILNALDSDRIIYGSIYRYEENKYWEEVKQEIIKL